MTRNKNIICYLTINNNCFLPRRKTCFELRYLLNRQFFREVNQELNNHTTLFKRVLILRHTFIHNTFDITVLNHFTYYLFYWYQCYNYQVLLYNNLPGMAVITKDRSSKVLTTFWNPHNASTNSISKRRIKSLPLLLQTQY